MFSSASTNAVSTETDLEIEIRPVIALSLSNCDSSDPSVISVNNSPTPNGTFKSACQTASVHTNAPGYTLTAKSSSSTLNYLNPTTVTPTPTIASTTSSTTTPSVLSNNTWGFGVQDRLNFTGQTYAIDNASNTYAGLPITDTTIYQADTFPLPETDHTFYYGTKLTTDTMAGTYTTTVTYTAVPSEVPETTYHLDDIVSRRNITTMQELTSSICSKAIYDNSNGGINDNNTVVLTDIRNNQDYRVRKMPDNKCWMIDNLKLATPGTALTLTSGDTNIAEGTTFTIPANAVTDSSNRATNGVCADGTTPIGEGGILTCTGVNTTATDATYGFIAYVDPGGTIACLTNASDNEDIHTYSPDSLSGCGYLYNWYTATAGAGNLSTTAESGDLTTSICPVGWHLPTGTSNGEFAVLNGSMAAGMLSASSIISDGTTYPNWRPAGLFSGAYSGWYYDNSGLDTQGSVGRYWTSRGDSTVAAYRVYLEYERILPGDLANRKTYGLAVRCVQ